MHVDTHHQLYLHHLVLSKILFEKEVVFHQISIYMKHNHMDKHLYELVNKSILSLNISLVLTKSSGCKFFTRLARLV